jgi:hypothetical protein
MNPLEHAVTCCVDKNVRALSALVRAFRLMHRRPLTAAVDAIAQQLLQPP